MSLEIFDREIDLPKGVKLIMSCDEFFDKGGAIIPDTEECKQLLIRFDHAIRHSDTSVKFKWKDEIYRATCLSSGAKAMICILARPDICFNVIECGDNVLNAMIKFKEGKIFMPFPNFAYDFSGSDDCDIIWRGKHYSSVLDFLGESEDVLVEE